MRTKERKETGTKNRYFAFFQPNTEPHYFAIRAHTKEKVDPFICEFCTHYTDKQKDPLIYYIGELTQFEIENFLGTYEIFENWGERK